MQRTASDGVLPFFFDYSQCQSIKMRLWDSFVQSNWDPIEISETRCGRFQLYLKGVFFFYLFFYGSRSMACIERKWVKEFFYFLFKFYFYHSSLLLTRFARAVRSLSAKVRRDLKAIWQSRGTRQKKNSSTFIIFNLLLFFFLKFLFGAKRRDCLESVGNWARFFKLLCFFYFSPTINTGAQRTSGRRRRRDTITRCLALAGAHDALAGTRRKSETNDDAANRARNEIAIKRRSVRRHRVN